MALAYVAKGVGDGCGGERRGGSIARVSEGQAGKGESECGGRVYSGKAIRVTQLSLLEIDIKPYQDLEIDI